MESGVIKKLDEEVVNCIAAGEIIQRPANALKELIENSIDAKATCIQTVVKSGGLKLLQVEDNGTGIHLVDLEIICKRFTTSKLRKFEDLSKINTFGFRGEALSSISHVSHLSIQTKTAQDPCGYKARYEIGKLMERPKRCASKQGTIIRIEDLFYNMPQRRHCIDSAFEEYHKICDIISKYSVHYSHVAFLLRKFDEQLTIKTSINSTQEQNIRLIYGPRITDNLMCIESENNKHGILKIKILATNAYYFAKHFHFILFINHRLVESSALKIAMERTYRSYLPKGMHPFVYIELEMNPLNVDVNVHPTKHQVSFLYENEIIELLRIQIENKLLENKPIRSLYKQLKLSCDSEGLQKSEIGLGKEKDMVRTDPKEQKLETLVRFGKTQFSQVTKMKEYCEHFLPQKARRGNYLSSIIRIQKQIEDNISISIRKIIKEIVFIGTIDKSFSLLQFQTSLCICNTIKLSKELFYQRLIYSFKKCSFMRMKPKLPVKDLILLALNCNKSNCSETVGNKNELAEQATLILKNNAPIMQEYFGLYINLDGELETLPILLENHYPCAYFLPNYLLRLATKVEWEEEERCFDSFSRETARFYSRVSNFEFQINMKHRKSIIEHVIYSALKSYLLPSENLKNCINELTTLSKLYKVFERC